MDDIRPGVFRSRDCDHRRLIDLCDDCMAALIVFLGPFAFEALSHLRKEAEGYRSLDG